MSDDKLIHKCQNCLWWDGDSSGEVGECMESEEPMTTNRNEECNSFLAREVDTPWSFP